MSILWFSVVAILVGVICGFGLFNIVRSAKTLDEGDIYRGIISLAIGFGLIVCLLLFGVATPADEQPVSPAKPRDLYERSSVGPVGPPGLPGHEQTPDEETPAPRQSSDWNPSDVTEDTGPRYRLWIDGKTWRYW